MWVGFTVVVILGLQEAMEGRHSSAGTFWHMEGRHSSAGTFGHIYIYIHKDSRS